jgi:Aldo/keto reductase family
MGDRLGLYRGLAGAGGLTPLQLAQRTGTAERYVREWLNAQAAGGFVEYDADGETYSLAPEQTVALTDAESPAFLHGFFQVALGSVTDAPRIIEAARTGDGIGWHEHAHDVHEGCERFFRPGYNANLVADWLPSLDGVVDKLTRGAKVADVGCGHGASTILMAQAFPHSTFTGPTTTTARSPPRAHAPSKPASTTACSFRLRRRPATKAPDIGVCEELEIGFLPFSPLLRGLLAGSLAADSGLDEGDFRSGDRFPRVGPEHRSANARLARVVSEIAGEHGRTPAQVALAWLLSRQPWIVPIPGTKRSAYVEDNALAPQLTLTDDDQRRLAALSAEVQGDRYGGEGRTPDWISPPRYV